jgi:hypothetical protein
MVVNPVWRQILLGPRRRVLLNAVTWNPADKQANTTLSNGNLTATSSSQLGGSRATHTSNKKKYFEYIITRNTAFNEHGFATLTKGFGQDLGTSDSISASYYPGQLKIFYASGNNVDAPNATTGDVIGFALDIAKHLFWVPKNGVWMNDGDPANGTNGLDYVFTADPYPMCLLEGGDASTINTGASSFAYPLPVGFYPWREVDLA